MNDVEMKVKVLELDFSLTKKPYVNALWDRH